MKVISRVININVVRNEFLERGLILLSDKYRNSKTKLNYKCPKHPEKIREITYGSFRSGCGCKECGYEKNAKNRKHTYEFIYSEFEKCGYKLLDKTYKNANTKMNYICSVHKDIIQQTTYARLKTGNRCPHCSKKASPTIEMVRNTLADKGYELLDSEYVSAFSPLYYKCFTHPDHPIKTNWGRIQNGAGCPYCANERSRGENNGFWKGGVTTLKKHLRENLSAWKQEYLNKYNYTCDITGICGNVVVHHLEKSFQEIRDMVLKEFPEFELKSNIGKYDSDELYNFTKRFLEVHDQYEGVVMNKKLHTNFHNIYGYTKNTKEQYLEYKHKIKGDV